MSLFPHTATLCFLILSTSVPAYAATENQDSVKIPAATSHPAGYLLRSGDVIHINVWKEEGLDQELQILPDGTVDFPLIGTFTAAGLTTAQVRDLVREKLKPFIPSANVTVMVKEARGNSVSVMGQVSRPGDVMMTRPINVLQALSQAGGLTTFADGDDIVILRTVDGKRTSISFDYDAVTNGHELESNIQLEPGDVIVVPSASLF